MTVLFKRTIRLRFEGKLERLWTMRLWTSHGWLAAMIAVLFATVSAAEERRSATIFDGQIEIEFGQFPDYPCADAIGHAAKCDVTDSRGMVMSHDCVDRERKHVQCVQPVLEAPVPPPGLTADRKHAVLAMPTQDLRAKPELVFRDNKTQITIRVQSDRRHVSAMDARGNLLWRRDPFSDSGTDPYRFAVPRITYVGPLTGGWQRVCDSATKRTNGDCALIGYDSTQSGLLNLRTGDLYILMQD